MGALTYACVTPAHDEADYLPQLAESLLAQTVRPERWVIVENGSRDETAAVAAELAARHDWIRFLQTEGRRPNDFDRAAPCMRAFNAGVASLGDLGDVIVKVDADVTFAPDFFAGILAAFAADPALGIASGSCHEWRDGAWREWILPGNHVWGPTRSYRRACAAVALPLDGTLGFSLIDLTKAQLAGFRVQNLGHLPFHHHRPEGTGEGPRWNAWIAEGEAAHYMQYRVSFLLGRCLYRLRKDRYALALLVGYAGAALRRQPRYDDEVVRGALRRKQRARHAMALALARVR